MRADEYFASEWLLEVPRLRRLLAGSGVAYDEIDDVVQETALKLFAAWGRVFEDAPVRPLVTTIALNVARDMRRRERSRPHLVPALPEVLDETPSVDRTAIARLEVTRTARAIASMPAARQRVLAQAVTDELAGEEQGRHRAPAAFRMALTRARRELATAVELAGGLVGVAIVTFRRVARSPATHAAALAAVGVGVVVAVAQPSAPDGGKPEPIDASSAGAIPAAIVATTITPGDGVASWSRSSLLGTAGSASLYQGLSQWVAPNLSVSNGWRPAPEPSEASQSMCIERVVVASIEYPCLPIV